MTGASRKKGLYFCISLKPLFPFSEERNKNKKISRIKEVRHVTKVDVIILWVY